MRKKILSVLMLSTLAFMVGCGQIIQQTTSTQDTYTPKVSVSTEGSKVIAKNTLTLEINSNQSMTFTNSGLVPLMIASQSVSIEADVPVFLTFTATSNLFFDVTNMGWIEANGYIQLNVSYNQLLNPNIENTRVRAYLVEDDGLVGQINPNNIIPLEIEVVNTKPYTPLTTTSQNLKEWLPPYNDALNEIIILKLRGDFTRALNQNFKGTLVLELITDERDIVPPAIPANFTAQSGDSVVTLNWTNPTDSDFDIVEIRRSTANYPAIDEGTSIYIGNNDFYIDSTVENGLVYYYSIFAKDENGNVSTPNTVSANPVASNPYEQYEVLNLKMDGTDQSFVDSSASNHTVTAIGDTTQVSGSAVFDGNGDYLQIADSDDFTIGTSLLTIDFWVKLNNVSSSNIFFSQYTSDTDRTTFFFSSDYGLRLIVDNAVVTTEGSPDSWAVNTWYHIAMVKNGANDYIIFKDGVIVGSCTNYYHVWDDKDTPIYIGRYGYTTAENGADYELNGELDNFRITKGIARWTTDFTPPARN